MISIDEFLDHDAFVKSGKRVLSGRTVAPQFAVIEWDGLPFYAMKFDLFESERTISSDKLHSDTHWHLFRFNETQASVVK